MRPFPSFNPISSYLLSSCLTLSHLISTQDMIYIFGGMSGTGPNYIFNNELWSYRLSSRTWTQLSVGTGGSQSAIIGGAEILPNARAFQHTAGNLFILKNSFYNDFFPLLFTSEIVFDSTTFLFFGGESSLGPLNDFWYVNVNVTCPY